MWSPELEAIARNIRNKANGYSWIYERIVSKAQRCENVLSILTGIFSAILGTGGLIATFEYDYGWIGIATAVIGFVNSVLSVLNATWNFGVIKTEGIISQTDFSNLSHNITLQLALDPNERIDGKEFITTIMKDIDDIILNAPTIDNDVKNQYIQRFKNNPIYNPEGQNKPSNIAVRPEYTESNQESHREAKTYRKRQKNNSDNDEDMNRDEQKTHIQNIQRRSNVQNDQSDQSDDDGAMISNWEASSQNSSPTRSR
jgi:hypothetical protein